MEGIITQFQIKSKKKRAKELATEHSESAERLAGFSMLELCLLSPA